MSSILICACCITSFPVKTYASTGNDTYSTATQIQSTSPIRTQLDDNNDVDWYKYTVDVSGHFSIELTSNENAKNYNLNVYNSELQDLGTEFDWGEMKAASQTYAYKKGTILYIKVSRDRGDVAGKTYGLNINATSASNWEVEGNGTKAKANSLTLGKAKYGTIYQLSDEDYYVYKAKKNGTVKFSFSTGEGVLYDGTSAEKGYDIEVLDSSKKSLKSAINIFSGKSLSFKVKKGKKYYIHVGSNSKGGYFAFTGPCDAKYSIKVKYK